MAEMSRELSRGSSQDESGLILRLKDQVTCPICLETFSEPKILPCLHTFCTKCIQQVIFRSSQNIIVCPKCRKEHVLNDVNRLSVDFNTLTLIDILSSSSEPPPPLPLPPPVSSQPSPPMVVKGDVDDPTLCGLHKEQCQQYCKDCHALVCRRCLSMGNHGNHTIWDMKEAKQHLFKEMKNLLEEANGLASEVEATLEGRRNQTELDIQNITNCKEVMEGYFGKANEHIQGKIRHYQDRLEKVSEHHVTLVAKLSEVQDALKKESQIDLDALDVTHSEIIQTTQLASDILNNSDSNQNLVCSSHSIVAKLKNVISHTVIPQCQVTSTSWSFSPHNDPLKTDIIDGNAIRIEGLKRAHLGANEFIVSYDKPLACQPVLFVEITYANGKKCQYDDIKIKRVDNMWMVLYYLSATSFPLITGFFSSHHITVSVYLGDIKAQGSPFHVPCDKILSKENFMNNLT